MLRIDDGISGVANHDRRSMFVLPLWARDKVTHGLEEIEPSGRCGAIA